jgi:hypothetical protein
MKHFKIFSLFFIIITVVMIVISSCKKDEDQPPIDKTKTAMVTFSPLLYGEVVPWLNSENKKSFGRFAHKYLGHVIRVRNDLGTWITDIPIVPDTIPPYTDYYTHAFNHGSYNAEVVPTWSSTPQLDSLNQAWGPAEDNYNRAGFYTRDRVNFTVMGLTNVTLNCVTDYSCLQLDLGPNYNWQDSIHYPIPEIAVIINDPDWLTAHLPPNEEATWAQLRNSYVSFNWNTFSPQTITIPEGDAEVGGFWHDVDADIFYMYMKPGNSTGGAHITNGLGQNGTGGGYEDFGAFFPTYLMFGISQESGITGAGTQAIWCKDYFLTRTWLGNTTLRITLTNEGRFTVIQQGWFETIIGGGSY